MSMEQYENVVIAIENGDIDYAEVVAFINEQ